MTRTYTRTLFHEDLTTRTFELFITDKCKWEADDEKKVTYKGVEAWSIVDGDDAKEIEACTDASCIDELHEYLVLHFADGDSATFRNSHVDMFVL